MGFRVLLSLRTWKAQGHQGRDSKVLGGHVIPCPWSNQLWVKDLNHESHLSHSAIIVGTYSKRKGLGKAYKLSIGY